MIKRSSSKRKTTNGSLSPSSPSSAQQHNISHCSSYDVTYLELIETLKRCTGQAVPKECFSRIMRAMKQAKCCNDQTANFSQEQIEDFYTQIISWMTVKSFEQPQILDLQSTKQLYVVLTGEVTLYQPNSVTENDEDDNHLHQDRATIHPAECQPNTFTSQIQQLQQEDSPPFHQTQLQQRAKDTPTGKGSSQFAFQGHTLLKRLNQYSVFGDAQSTSEIPTVNCVARVTSDTILSCVSHRSIEQLLRTNIREMYLRVELLEQYIPSVSTKSIMALSKQLTLVVLSRGQVIYSEGDPGNNIYFIKEGEVTFYKKIHNNNKDNQPNNNLNQQVAEQNQLSNTDNDKDAKRSSQQQDTSGIPASEGGSASSAAASLLLRRRKKGSLEVSLSEINKGQMFGQDEVLLKLNRQKTAKATSTGVELYVLEAQHLFAFLEKLDQSSGEGKHVFQSLLGVSAHKEAFYSEMVSKVQRVEDKQIGQTIQIRNILDRQNKVKSQIQQSQAQEDKEKNAEEICDFEGGSSQNREFEKELTRNQSSIREIGQKIENNKKFMDSASNKQFMVDNSSSNTMRVSNSTYAKDSEKILNSTEGGKKRRLKVDFGNPLFEELAANNSERIKKIHHNYNNSNLSSQSTIPHTRPTQNLIEALLKLSQNGIINSSSNSQGNTKVAMTGNNNTNNNNDEDDNSSTPVENGTQNKINSNGAISSNNCINDGNNITSMGWINTVANGNANLIASAASKRNSISISISAIASNNISHRNSVVFQEASRRSSMISNINLDGSQSMSIAAMPTSNYSPSSLSCCTTPKAQLLQQQQLQYLMLARKKSKFQQLSQRGNIQQQEDNSNPSNTTIVTATAEKQTKVEAESRETDFVPEQTEHQAEQEDTHSGRNSLLIPSFQRYLSAQASSRNSQHRNNSMRLFSNGVTATMSDEQQQSPMQHFSSCQSPTASNTPPRMNHLLHHSRTFNKQSINNNSKIEYNNNNNNLSNVSPKSYSNSNATPKSNCCHHSSSFLVGNQQTQQQKQLVNSPSSMSQSDQSPQQGSSQQKGTQRPHAISGFKELANQVLSGTEEEEKSLSTKQLNDQNQGGNTPASLNRITEKHTSQTPNQQQQLLLHGVIQTRKISSAASRPFLTISTQKGCSETESLKQTAGDFSGCMKTSSWFAGVSKQQPRTTTAAAGGVVTPLNNYLNIAQSQESLILEKGGSQTDCVHSPLCQKDYQNRNYPFINRTGIASPVSPSGLFDYQLTANSKNTHNSNQKSYEMLSPFQRPSSSYCSPCQPTKSTTMRCAKEINSSSININKNNQTNIQIGSQSSSSQLKSPKSNSLFNTARRCSLKYPQQQQSSQSNQYSQQQFHSSSLITPIQTPITNQWNSDYNNYNNSSSSKVVLTEPFTICKRGSNSTLKLFKHSNPSYSSATQLQYYMPSQCHVQDFYKPLGVLSLQQVAQVIRSDKHSDYQTPGAATPNETEYLHNKTYIANQSNLMASRKTDTFTSALIIDKNTVDNNNNMNKNAVNNMNENGRSTESATTPTTATLMESCSPKQQLLKVSFNFRRLSKPSSGSHNHSTNKPNGSPSSSASASGVKSTKTNKSHSQFMTQPDGGDTVESTNQFLSSKSMKTQPSEQDVYSNHKITQDKPKENRCCQVKVFPVDSPGVQSGQTKDSSSTSAQQQRLFKQLTSIFPNKLTQTNRADAISNRNIEQQNQSSSEKYKQTKNIHISQRKAATVILSESALGGTSTQGFFSKVCSPLKTPTKANLQCRQITRRIPSRNLKDCK